MTVVGFLLIFLSIQILSLLKICPLVQQFSACHSHHETHISMVLGTPNYNYFRGSFRANFAAERISVPKTVGNTCACDPQSGNHCSSFKLLKLGPICALVCLLMLVKVPHPLRQISRNSFQPYCWAGEAAQQIKCKHQNS